MANVTDKKHCPNCKKDLPKNKFYNSRSPLAVDGLCNICSACVKKQVDINKIETVYNVLKSLNLPFVYRYWQSAIEGNGDTFGNYMRMCNSLKQLKGTTWEDSEFEEKKEDNSIQNSVNQNIDRSKYDLEALKEKYGYGYPDEEYYLFEKKYQQLRPSVKILTTMHDEFFREYCVDKVKETLAKAKGDFKEAKEWATMAKDASTAGKLNPNQMSKADLTGGMDTFGQMRRMVEETSKGELLGLLPKFVERPKDNVDITLWLYINYVRDLKGLPECEYKEIYNFYEVRKQSYEQQSLDYELLSSDKETGDLDA